MVKRKRDSKEQEESAIKRHKEPVSKPTIQAKGSPHSQATNKIASIQIITGSYDKILHGILASLSWEINRIGLDKLAEGDVRVQFADTFLFNAHTSAIRCLALSPLSHPEDYSKPQKLILASGSTDERINLYHISGSIFPLQSQETPSLPSIGNSPVKENPRNRELGALLHHSSSINALYFPTRSKLLSAADDNTIAISRTRDWTVLSTIKAPIPKAVGRPSGDTATLGSTPAGINDFAVHPSMKLMISVGKGEKCMRLWNLVTGKKAGVLNFERELLEDIGTSRWGSGEGLKVEWNEEGTHFAVGFEKGVVIFGMDCKPECRVVLSSRTKLHQLHFATRVGAPSWNTFVLSISTEDGRILFYSTRKADAINPEGTQSKSNLPICKALGQLGGKELGVTSRIKDFEIVQILDGNLNASKIFITASSDGSIGLWNVTGDEILDALDPQSESLGPMNERAASSRQIGQLLGTYETGNRITCLKAFVMQQNPPTTQNASSVVSNKEKDEDN